MISRLTKIIVFALIAFAFAFAETPVAAKPAPAVASPATAAAPVTAESTPSPATEAAPVTAESTPSPATEAAPVTAESTPSPATEAAPVTAESTPSPATEAAPVTAESTPSPATEAAPVTAESTPSPATEAAPVTAESTPSPATEAAPVTAESTPSPATEAAPAPLVSSAVRQLQEREGRLITVPSSEARSISAAMAKARPGDTVRVKNGVYRESIHITPGVLLVSENLFKAVLDGRGRNTVVTMGNASTIDGFEIRRGTIGVFSTSAGAVIRRNRITHNIQSGVMCVGTLPKMEDNFIVFNRGSGVQGWDVRTTSGSINHNTIAFNTNHGVSLGGTTSITLENNIIAFNDQFGVKPGEETVRVELINNNLYRNARISSNLPSDNISADPQFIDPKRFNFNLTNGSSSVGMGTDNQNLGARILH